MSTVYLVMDNRIESNEVIRVYLDEGEAQAFADAHNATRSGSYYEVEPHHVGAPDAEFDGPVWVASWSTRRKQVGERQLVLVREDGFIMVVPSAVPSGGGYSFHEMFYSPARPAPEYEEPPVWIDHFVEPWQEWWTGDLPPEAEIHSMEDTRCTVRGTSKEAVEQLLRSVARGLKVGLGGTTA